MVSAKNKLKVVLDTNVFISAILFGGIPQQIMESARNGEIELLTSSSILFELASILQGKFKFSRTIALDVISEIKRTSSVIFTKTKLSVIEKDHSDNMILECAVDGFADYIVSGDKKHLRPLNSFKGIKIRLPQEFIKEIK